MTEQNFSLVHKPESEALEPVEDCHRETAHIEQYHIRAVHPKLNHEGLCKVVGSVTFNALVLITSCAAGFPEELT